MLLSPLICNKKLHQVKKRIALYVCTYLFPFRFQHLDYPHQGRDPWKPMDERIMHYPYLSSPSSTDRSVDTSSPTPLQTVQWVPVLSLLFRQVSRYLSSPLLYRQVSRYLSSHSPTDSSVGACLTPPLQTGQ